MRFHGLIDALYQSEEYNLIKAAFDNKKLPCQVHGLSESQKAFVSYGIFEGLNSQILVLAHNEIEARKLYDDIRTFTNACVFFPIKEMVFNVDVTSGDIKRERLEVIKRVLDKERIIVVTSIDAIFYKMPPVETLSNSRLLISRGDTIDILDLASRLIDFGYERVNVIEGRGQFAQRGGILDIFSPTGHEPVRIEFFGDEIDTIRTFDILTQRSQEMISDVEIYPAREIIMNSEDMENIIQGISKDYETKLKSYSKKNKDVAARFRERISENIDKLRNYRYFDGIDSYIPYIYKNAVSFIDYFDDPVIILDESGRIAQRIKNASEEFQEVFKSLLEKGDVLPAQGEYMFEAGAIIQKIKETRYLSINMLPRVVEDFKPLSLVNFSVMSINPLSGNIEFLLDEIRTRISKKYRILIMAGTEARAQRLNSSLKEQGFNSEYKEEIDLMTEGKIVVTSGSISRGMEFPGIRLSIISDKEVYKDRKAKPRPVPKKGRKIESFTDIKAGDYVVHVNHGIGIFKGIKELVIEGIKRDYLVLQYQGGDTLYVPVEQLDMVQKYIGSDGAEPKIYKLGGSDWAKTKKKVKDSLKEMAEDLVKLYAMRSTMNGHAYSKDTPWQRQFEDEFPYEETRDQIIAIEEIKRDMESPRPMDRLLCGDVGYGKTEVAIRAAFKAVMDGKQVAVLVPTTILAEQHYNNFVQRFADFPVTIDMISRFRNREQQRKTIRNLAAGNVDIIIGTHRILQKDLKFKDLGLLIIDEEQRFGVAHKEKIKALKKNIDVLTLTATPIPRTLHMSLSGVRDMSIIETPPEERYPVQTYVMEYSEGIIRDAIIREMSRGGQVFFVYNRVENIKDMELALSRLVPEAKIVIGHGQMEEKELEEVILSFISGEGDILLCTTIIETGIDMPNVNTLIVYDADRMGLSQLYQLRGRVGRSNRLAYAYFTYRRDKVLSEAAEKRLKAIKEFTEFGSGFKIAMRDLEIRGAGNILGTQQHGHMAAVGYDLYTRLLEEAIREISGEEKEDFIETTIEIPINAYIPDNYIEDQMLKIEMYKKIASIESKEDKIDMEEEMTDRFGDIPKSLENLINIAYVKGLAKKIKVTSIKQIGKEIILQFKDGKYIDIDTLRKLNSKMNGAVSYGSSTLPILKIKLESGKFDTVGKLKEVIEGIIGLHNI